MVFIIIIEVTTACSYQLNVNQNIRKIYYSFAFIYRTCAFSLTADSLSRPDKNIKFNKFNSITQTKLAFHTFIFGCYLFPRQPKILHSMPHIKPITQADVS